MSIPKQAFQNIPLSPAAFEVLMGMEELQQNHGPLHIRAGVHPGARTRNHAVNRQQLEPISNQQVNAEFSGESELVGAEGIQLAVSTYLIRIFKLALLSLLVHNSL